MNLFRYLFVWLWPTDPIEYLGDYEDYQEYTV